MKIYLFGKDNDKNWQIICKLDENCEKNLWQKQKLSAHA